MRQKPCVYLFEAPASKLVKIGWTTGPAERRLQTIQNFSPEPLYLIGYFEVSDGHRSEFQMHAALKEERQHSEWFLISADEAVARLLPVAEKIGGVFRDLRHDPVCTLKRSYWATFPEKVPKAPSPEIDVPPDAIAKLPNYLGFGVRQIAEVLSCEEKHVRQLVKDGKLKAKGKKTGNNRWLVVLREDLVRFLTVSGAK